MKPDEQIEMLGNGPLPQDFKKRAYLAANEFALYKEDALKYLQWCKANGYEVLGYEIWFPTNPGPTTLIASGIAGGNGDADTCYNFILNDDFTEEEKKHGLNIVFNICVDAE